jgi:predicted acylesterase/phospholipase RssA
MVCISFRDRARLATLGLLGLAVVIGCRSQQQVPAQPFQARALAPVESPSVVPPGVTLDGPLTPDPGMRPPRHVLALSSGGLYGAYSTGFLAGWSRAGTRPVFDVVTGVSTGALAAPFAFLGPEYDDRLQKLYTGVRAEDVFQIRTWVTIPFKDAAASSAPLRLLIDSQVTQPVLDRIASEHRKGRRLYVATTNLDTRRLVVWDMGAIASQSGPHSLRLFRDVLLASASVPGMLPPVTFTVDVDGQPSTELHVDGGVASQIFVPSVVFRAAAASVPPGAAVVPGAGGNLYAVVAGKLYPDARPVKQRVLRILGATTETILHAHCRAELMSLYGQARVAGMQYHLTALRQDAVVKVETNMNIDPGEMSKLYAEGLKDGVAGPLWRYAPPEICPGEGDQVRGGLRLPSTPGSAR